MALDAETIGRLAEELNERLRDGRIEKIRQPEKDLLLFGIRRYGENSRLLIRAGGPNARMHLTERNYENPPNAPMFCMLLRKYLKGACILDIRQVNGDRIVVMTLEGRTELGAEMHEAIIDIFDICRVRDVERLLKDDPSSIDVMVEEERGYTRLSLSIDNGPVDGGSPTILWQQRCMHIKRPVFRHGPDHLWQHPESHHHLQVGPVRAKRFYKLRVFHLFGLQHGQTVLHRILLHS